MLVSALWCFISRSDHNDCIVLRDKSCKFNCLFPFFIFCCVSWLEGISESQQNNSWLLTHIEMFNIQGMLFKPITHFDLQRSSSGGLQMHMSSSRDKFTLWRTWQCSWLSHCVISCKVMDLIFIEFTGFLQMTQSFHLHCGPGVNSGYNRNEYQESSKGKGQLVST